MENVNKVDEAMIMALRGANTITIDIDSGDKEFKLNSHFESMLEIGAFIISHTRATTVRITANDDDNKRKIIDFNPHTGEWNIVVNDWVNNRPSIVTLEINEAGDEGLWEHMHDNNLRAMTGRREWAFYGTYSDIENFIRSYYFANERDEELVQETLDSIVDDADKM